MDNKENNVEDSYVENNNLVTDDSNYYDDNGYNYQGMDYADEDYDFQSKNNFGMNMARSMENKSNPALGLKNKNNKDIPNKNKNSRENNDNSNNQNDNQRSNQMPGTVKKPDSNRDNGYTKNDGNPKNNGNSQVNNKNKDNRNGAGRKNGAGPSKKNGLNRPKGLGVQDKKNEISSSLGGAFNNLTNGIKESGFKFLLKKEVIAFLPILLVVLVFFVILLGVLGSVVYSGTTGTSYCGGSSYDLSVIDSSRISYTYTGVFQIHWAHSSPQFQNFKTVPTYVDEDGFLRSGDAYLIALGSYFGIENDGKKQLKMGTKYLIKLKNGVEFVGMLADAKADAHTSASSQHAQHTNDGSVVEFEMGCGDSIDPVAYGFNFSGSHKKSCVGMQNVINKKFSGPIESISLLDSEGASCNFSNGVFPVRTKYFSSSELTAIFNACPGCRSQYYNVSHTTCVTYGKLRASEIIMTADGLTDEYRKKALAAISAATGNGWYWSGSVNPGLKDFNYDATCNTPKPGSFISWHGNNTKCNAGNSPVSGLCGHVGIIEAVEGDKIIVTDGYTGSRFNKKEFTLSELKRASGGCVGITYLFEYKG